MSNAKPMTLNRRLSAYYKQNGQEDWLTHRQWRRVAKKLGKALNGGTSND